MSQTFVSKLLHQANITGCLNISSKQFGKQDICSICEQNLEGIEQLYIYNNGISIKGIMHLRRGNWANIKDINLNNSNIGDSGCRYLTWTSFPKLQSLALWKNNIHTAGVQHLTKAPWTELTKIKLSDNRLSIDTLKMFVRSTWKKLQTIELRYLLHEQQQFYLFEAAHFLLFKYDSLKNISMYIRDEKAELFLSWLTRRYNRQSK